MFGIGQLSSQGMVRNIGMGRSGLALSSDEYLNNLNPASNHKIDSISFFFDVGTDATISKYSSSELTQYGNYMNLRNIAMGFRMMRRWTGSLGVVPFSSVGYKVQAEDEVEGTPDKVKIDLSGTGGISQLYWDNTFTVFDRFNVGVKCSYLFGKIQYLEVLHYSFFDKDVILEENSNLNKVFLDFGLQYDFSPIRDFKVSLGGVYGTNHLLNLNRSRTVSDSKGAVYEEKTKSNEVFELPAYAGGGLAIQYKKNLTLTADYLYHNWQSVSTGDISCAFRNTHAYRFGLEYVPGYIDNFRFLGRMNYRLGYYYEDSYLEIANTGFADQGFSAGIGIPFFQTKTSLNLAYNNGTRGTLDRYLIKERYHVIMLSLCLHDWWFIKRKYD